MSEQKLSDLIGQAEREGKWIQCHYQDLWFSPADLRRANKEGRFNWGPQNFSIRDPKDKLRAIVEEIERLKKTRNVFERKIRKGDA